MAVGRCHLGLCHHWQRLEADTGDVHCKRRRRLRINMSKGMSMSRIAGGRGMVGVPIILGD